MPRFLSSSCPFSPSDTMGKAGPGSPGWGSSWRVVFDALPWLQGCGELGSGHLGTERGLAPELLVGPSPDAEH